jgi:hypothetical protein
MDFKMNSKNVNIIFIGGTGRSGTNITKELLSLHSKVATLPFEHRFIIDPFGIIDFYNSYPSAWSPYIADKKIKQLENFLLSLSEKKKLSNFKGSIIKKIDKTGKKLSPDSYHGWELNKWFPNYETHVKNLISKLKTFEYSAVSPSTDSYTSNNKMYFSPPLSKKDLSPILSKFLYDCIGDLLKKENKSHFVEDNTWNILFSKELFELLPQSSLIHVIRDPRDVIASLVRQRWCPSELSQATKYYKAIINQWFEIKKELSTSRFLEIKLEDLVKEPKNTLEKICLITNLSYEESLLKVDLTKSHTGRWKSEFTENEQKFLNDELSDIFVKLNY